jgi:hypothetical protein
MYAITKYSIPYETKKKGTSNTSVAAGIHHAWWPCAGPIQAEWSKKTTAVASGLFEFRRFVLWSTDAIAAN